MNCFFAKLLLLTSIWNCIYRPLICGYSCIPLNGQRFTVCERCSTVLFQFSTQADFLPPECTQTTTTMTTMTTHSQTFKKSRSIASNFQMRMKWNQITFISKAYIHSVVVVVVVVAFSLSIQLFGGAGGGCVFPFLPQHSKHCAFAMYEYASGRASKQASECYLNDDDVLAICHLYKIYISIFGLQRSGIIV